MQAEPFWIAGRPATGSAVIDVQYPYDGRTVASVFVPSAEQVEEAVAAMHAARDVVGATSAHRRASALSHVADRLEQRLEEAAQVIVLESGKPIKWARVEVARAASTFRWAAEEARRWSGTLQRLDTDAGGAGRLALVRRFPRGSLLAITPFNFPLNLVAHKVAPAIAVGAPVIIKPAPSTPLSSLFLGQLLADTDLHQGSWSVLPVPNSQMEHLVLDPRIPVISFTGSGPVGWDIKSLVPRKHVTLELGGNAAAVVCSDWSSEQDLEWAAQRIALFANYQAGQSCISVQRVYVPRELYEVFTVLLSRHIGALRQGNPNDDATDVGPVINEASAIRIEQWIDDAVHAGAKILVGGRRNGTSLEPTLLADVPLAARILRDEAFGPVVSITPFDSLDSAFAAVNDSDFGLQTGVFTRDIRTAFRAHRDLEVGGVIIGDVPSYRADQMPYGGMKDSGIGREGVRSAMDDFTVEKVLVLAGVAL
ncbi:aldehyde dehydrogenase family protein [Rhodococcus ruber]|uniref:Aldehyde Dehydrogenase n=1 Tax=Pseudonocardia dioxanivorans (strain ATCC 55486 / DSM 44775 / JCM 13855 / CB1190) TaxID=675635 RepID=F2L769_PSEUX|nr:aldehyde dehydrogenase family protein [Pseudonocardia dioxanivorans]AEA29042.1 Aldehyde Dehydrogenase [Pseudonocardia dioxanivorans CB1190]AUM20146.1 aldehyde dehydrogenase [Rhodococcus ruber]MBD8057133.1 aldehyde dehydrogenase family protein [Rhodococcus ruber]